MRVDWDAVWADLEPALHRVADAVSNRSPGIGTRVSRGPASPATVFHAQVSFAHLPLVAPVEDVLLDLRCGPSATGGFYGEDGRLLFPAAGDQHAIKCEIERGTGESIARLEAMLLPSDPGSVEYRDAVASYVAAASKFGEDNIDTIAGALDRQRH